MVFACVMCCKDRVSAYLGTKTVRTKVQGNLLQVESEMCACIITYLSSDPETWPTITVCCCGLVAKSSLTFLRPHGLQPTRLLCSWAFPNENTGVDWHFRLHGVFLTQGSNPCLLHWQADSLPLSHQERGSLKNNRIPAFILVLLNQMPLRGIFFNHPSRVQ